jgi:hypothetical protein
MSGGERLEDGGGALMADMDVDEVYNHFIVAMLWSTLDNERMESTGEETYFEDNYNVDDVEPRCAEAIKKKIRKFLDENQSIIAELEISEEMVGHDLWLDTAGHGVGFRDRGYGKKGDALSKSAKKFFDMEDVEGYNGKITLGMCRGQ